MARTNRPRRPVLAATIAVVTLAGCNAAKGNPAASAATVAANPPAEAAPVGRTFVHDCQDDLSFIVRTGPGEVALWLPAALGGEYRVLAATPAASGAKYTEGDTVFWSKGDLATFEVEGKTYADCRTNPAEVPWADAARRGATFRALGQEPSWHAEVYPDHLVLVTDLGAQRTEAPLRRPLYEGARETYRAKDRDLTLVVERRTCMDTMSGESFEAEATLTFDGRTYRGCGRWL